MAVKKTDSEITKDQPTPKNIYTPRLFMIAGGVLLVLGLVAYQFKGQFISAMVNGKPITRASYIKALESQGGKQVLTQLITEQLITDEAFKKNLTIPPDEITAEVATITENLKTQGQELNQALTEQGMTMKDLEHQIMMRKLVASLTADQATVSAEEIAKYITENKKSLPSAKEATQSEIEAMVKKQLTQTKQQTVVNTWLADLEKNADIQYW
jgi:hypothetical protein